MIVCPDGTEALPLNEHVVLPAGTVHVIVVSALFTLTMKVTPTVVVTDGVIVAAIPVIVSAREAVIVLLVDVVLMAATLFGNPYMLFGDELPETMSSFVPPSHAHPEATDRMPTQKVDPALFQLAQVTSAAAGSWFVLLFCSDQ